MPKKFEQKYKDVLSVAPRSDIDKIQYFASIMLNFLPSIFHGKQEERLNAYIDFSEFYLLEFDMAYSQYRKENQKHEKEYLFRFTPLKPNILEHKLHDSLTQLSAKNNREKAEIILWQACRLFELYHLMDALF